MGRKPLLWALPLLMVAFFLPAGCRRKPELQIDEFVVEHQLPLQWSELEPGLSFARLEFSRTDDSGRVVVAAVRAEPASIDFDLLDAPTLLDRPSASVESMAEKAGATAAVNASFYLPETYKPIGLIVSDSKVRNAWKKGAGSGVFWVKDGTAKVDWSREFREEWKRADLAVQAGPLVIEPGGKPGIRSNAQNIDARTSIGLDDHHRVILTCTLREDRGDSLRGLDLYELMRILAAAPDKGGLGLKAALNLDGGTSTALFLQSRNLSFKVKSVHPVRNGIGLKSRQPWK